MMLKKGFTLAELLIALVILGVIATFTIPKVLQTQQNTSYNAAAKETIGAVSGAYQSYVRQNGSSTVAGLQNFTTYLNYVRVDSTDTIDDHPPFTTADCSAWFTSCLKMHNGAILEFWNVVTFGDTAATSCVWFNVDPDGTGPAKSVDLLLYYNGFITSKANTKPNSYDTESGTPTALPVADPAYDPSWFSWN